MNVCMCVGLCMYVVVCIYVDLCMYVCMYVVSPAYSLNLQNVLYPSQRVSGTNSQRIKQQITEVKCQLHPVPRHTENTELNLRVSLARHGVVPTCTGHLYLLLAHYT
jgi:hypothetical protein